MNLNLLLKMACGVLVAGTFALPVQAAIREVVGYGFGSTATIAEMDARADASRICFQLGFVVGSAYLISNVEVGSNQWSARAGISCDVD